MRIEWKAPAGGLWELESTHVRGGQPRVFQELAPTAFRDCFRETAARYGLPVDYVEVRFVNDHCYARMRPIGAPEPKPGKPSKAPPAFVLKVLARVHPELRRRARAARRAIDEQLWNVDRRQWEQHGRARLLDAARALQSEAIEELDDAALVDHLRRAADHLERGIGTHFELLPIHNVPVGRMLLASRGWGIDPGDVFPLFAGTSPASTASAEHLATIARALDQAGVEPHTLDDIRAASLEAAAALDAYLADFGWRVVTQYSPRGLALVELPDVLLRAIAVAAESADPPPAVDVNVVRDRVPAAERDRFDELLGDARACYGVRDDNVALTFMWPSGLVRRALLEAGRRLADRGVLREDAHVFALGQAEIAAALAGDTSLGDEAASRTAHIAAAEADGAPAQLGADEGPPPDPNLFPAAIAELLAAILMEFELEQAFKTERVETAGWTGTGAGVGTAPYTGRACVAASAEEALDRLQPGDVLITAHTTPAFEAIMAVAGALVTDHGGLMSHAALVCREHGIAAVVGVTAATSHIPDGATVTVDPTVGHVSIDSTAPKEATAVRHAAR
ncbi:MAG TPA: PEP-utilizing enzyme [Acidimicrobiales bacterium]|nr:PEP-utilizing enzyme [Acidimicrobiales bacterium]